MGTPNSTALEKTTSALLKSDILEEKELGDRVAGTMEQLVATLKPLLKYLITGGDHKEIAMYERGSRLCVNRNGEFFIVAKDGAVQHDKESSESPWLLFPISAVIDGLEKLHREVAEAREKRLTDIKDAHSRLAKIQEILNPPMPPSAHCQKG